VALLRLVRLEQIDRRGGIFVLRAGLVTHRLGDDTGLLREMRGLRMVEIIRVLERMGQYESGVLLAIDVDNAVEMFFVELERRVAAVEERDLGAEQVGGALRLVLAARFGAFPRRAVVLPGELAVAAFAEGEADGLRAIAGFGVQGDGAAGTPDDVAWMRS